MLAAAALLHSVMWMTVEFVMVVVVGDHGVNNLNRVKKH
jgi:hypothetical protein